MTWQLQFCVDSELPKKLTFLAFPQETDLLNIIPQCKKKENDVSYRNFKCAVTYFQELTYSKLSSPSATDIVPVRNNSLDGKLHNQALYFKRVLLKGCFASTLRCFKMHGSRVAADLENKCTNW